MRKITSKKEANEFYKIVNDHIDDYITNWKVDPRNLKKYFSNKKKREQFLSRTGLNDVERINTILDDVLDDRDAMIRDNVLKFESFFIAESIELSSNHVEHEKVLADLFKTSLSHIDVKDKESNHFLVDDLGSKHEVCIFSQKDFEAFKEQISKSLFDEAKSEDLDLYQIKIEEGRNLKTKINISIADIIDSDKLKAELDKSLSENKMIAIITSWLNRPELLRSKKKFNFFKSYHNYYIWKLVD